MNEKGIHMEKKKITLNPCMHSGGSLNYLLAYYERDLKVIVDGSLKAWAQKREWLGKDRGWLYSGGGWTWDGVCKRW